MKLASNGWARRGLRGRLGAGLGMVCLLGGAAFLGGCDNYNIPIVQTNTGTSLNGSLSLQPSGIIFVDVGKSRVVTAVLTNDPGNLGVQWLLTGPGTLTNVTRTSVTYLAPTAIDVPANITAQSLADTTQIAGATLYSVPQPNFVTTSVPGGTVGAGYNTVITATNGSTPYNWSLESGSLPPGVTFNVTSLSSITLLGTPTQAGTFNFKFQVNDVCGSIVQQSFSVLVAAGTSPNTSAMIATLAGAGENNALLQGNYAFQFGGFGPAGMTASAGSFVADGNGNISGGLADRNSGAGAQVGQAFTGTYSIGPNQLGVMKLSFADGTGATYAVAASSGGNARFIEFDDSTGLGTHGSGQLKKQDLASLGAPHVAGNYAFELAGLDAQGARLGMAGQFGAADSSTVTQGVLDVNDAGTVANLGGVTGSYSLAANGVGNAVISAPGIGTARLSLYAVSADEAFAVQMDGAGKSLLIGSVMRQAAGTFTSAAFSGNDVVQMAGFANAETQMEFGLMSANASGNAALSAAKLTGDGASEMDATYTATVGSNGRTTLGSSVGPGADSPIIYFVRPNEGFVLGTDASVMTGWMQPQTAVSITGASFTGTVAGGSIFPSIPGMTESVVALSFDGKGNVIGTGATSGPNGMALLPVQKGTYSVGAGDIFLSVSWPLQSPQPMLIVSAGKLIVIPAAANFAPIAVQK